MDMLEKLARKIYSFNPNGTWERIPTTDPISFIQIPSTSTVGNNKHFVPDPWEEAQDRHEQCYHEARELLLTLREPTDEMVEAGEQARDSLGKQWIAYGEGFADAPTETPSRPQFQAMIDAASKD